MQVTEKKVSDTKVELHIVADEALLIDVKKEILQKLNRQIKVQGFRKGKAPLGLVERHADQSTLQTEFLDLALNRMYGAAIDEQKLRPVDRPEVGIAKFVPFITLEVTATVEVVGDVKLPDYTKIKQPRTPVTIVVKDIDEVIESLQVRAAEKKSVERPAQDGDEVIIDFKGVDTKTKDPIGGADGKDYPLLLGSNAFIPGFEEHLIGVKPNITTEFTIAFPKDYGVKALQSKQVSFTVTITKVQELVKPKADDVFAVTVGPFKTLDELKSDIKKQLTLERQNQADRQYEDTLLTTIADKSTIAVPESLLEQEITRLETEERQDLMYRGQTWEEHLASEGLTEAEHREQKRPQAERRVKAGLVLAEIAEREGITVSAEELETRITLLKGQYQDKQMQAELDKPDNRRDIASRLLTEKTIQKLVGYATAT